MKMKKWLWWLMVGLVWVTLSGCKENENIPEEKRALALDDIAPYRADGAYGSVLKSCVIVNDLHHSCQLTKLPLLRYEQSHPSKKTIMQRVVVSDKWMGDRFAEVLDILDDDIKELLGAVTAIVIDNDIRPSYYSIMTGALYLDPRYLWLTPKESDTITPQKDYRHDYGKKLSFLSAHRYVKNNNYAYTWYGIDSNVTRDLNSIRYMIARLLYHELAHANDYAPKEIDAKIDRNKSIYSALSDAKEKRISNKLYATMPLRSDTLKRLGRIFYRGETANADDKALDAEVVGALFEEDGANEMYNYSSLREDLAMMFEAVMMKRHYGIEMDTGFLDKPTVDKPVCSDYILRWGSRNRIAEPRIIPRARFVAKAILPDVTSWDDFFATGIGEAQTLKAGKDWCRSINLGSAADNKSLGATFEKTPEQMFFRELE
jgi:hypothetical protein